MKINRLPFPLILVALAAIAPVRADVILEASRFLVDSDAPINPTFNLVNETGGDNNSILLLGLTMDSNTAMPLDEVTLTWSGGTAVSGTQLTTIVRSGGANQTAIFGWDIGNLEADETVTFNNASTYGREVFSMVQLSGATLTGAVANSSSGTGNGGNVTLTGTAEGSFAFGVAMIQNNARSLSSTSGPLDASSYANLNNRGQFRMHELSTSAGDQTYGFGLSGSSDGWAFSAVVLPAVIPEPGTLVLFGLAAASLLVTLQRRR